MMRLRNTESQNKVGRFKKKINSFVSWYKMTANLTYISKIEYKLKGKCMYVCMYVYL
jgi:hypothetical protein